MKVNMNQIPDDDKKSKAPFHADFLKKKAAEPEQETETAEESDSTEDEPSDDEEAPAEGNVYAEALKGYRDKWKEQSKSGKGILQNNKFWIVVCVILFLMFVSANSKLGGTKTRYLSQIKRTNTEAANLQDAVEELKLELEEQAKIDAIKLTEEEEELARNNAEAQGVHVAYLQNKYDTIPAVKDQSEYETEDDWKQARNEQQTAYNNIKAELVSCFDENAGIKNWQWYTCGIDGIPGKWEFVTNASFKGNTSRSLWLCYANDPSNPNDHSMLAYCTATYNADTKTFSHVEVKLTSYAEMNSNKYDPEYVDMDQMSIQERLNALQERLNALAEQGTTKVEGGDSFGDSEVVNENDDARQSHKEKVKNDEVEGEEYDPNYDPGLDNSDDSAPEGIE